MQNPKRPLYVHSINTNKNLTSFYRLIEDKWKKLYYIFIFRKKETGQIATLTWSIVRIVPVYSTILKKCVVCFHEKLETLKYPSPEELLKKRFEIMNYILYIIYKYM